jgi:RNA-directed DNA polymerase
MQLKKLRIRAKKPYTGPNRTAIRDLQRKKFHPLILKAIRPLAYIRKRSAKLAKKAELDKKEKFEKLFSIISNKYTLLQALGKISVNKGSSTPGIDNKTYDAMSIKRIEKLSESLKNGTFKFSPYRRKMIPKPVKKGQPPKSRPLGIPNFDDRIVQEAIRLVLDAIYEPIFQAYECHFGFRSKKSCHDAIEKLKKTGTACDFAIEGDIKGAFDNVDPDILLQFLKKRISDNRLLNLISQGFKCGLLEQGVRKDTLLGVPQGGIASPLLFNIYMHEFDMFILNELQAEIDIKNKKEGRTSTGPNNPVYAIISQRLTRRNHSLNKILSKSKMFVNLSEQDKAKVKDLHKSIHHDYEMRAQVSSVIQSKRRIRIIYVRYADDWIILTNANRNYCNEIKSILGKKLKDMLKLELSPEKKKITNLKNSKANFLGFSIYTYRNTNRKVVKGKIVKTAGYAILIGIDMNRMIDRLVAKGFCKDSTGHRPIAKPSYSVLAMKDIITTYNSIIRGFANYYLPKISRVKDLIRVIYILEYSAYMTIAKKQNSKITKIREKYGKPLTISITQTEFVKGRPLPKEVNKTFTLLDYKTVKDRVKEAMSKSGSETFNIPVTL